jgi:hypothetical protein
MRLTIINGSPRVQKSNTKILLDHFLRGFNETKGNFFAIDYIYNHKDLNELVKLFENSEIILIAFPVFVDSMPAEVKAFIELLEPICGKNNNQKLGFIIQSGYPEANHLRYLERYLNKLAKRLNCNYLGSVIKPGIEGIKVKPFFMINWIFRLFYKLGKEFGEKGVFDEKLVQKLAAPEKTKDIISYLSFKLITTGYYYIELFLHGKLLQRYNRPALKGN